MDEHQNSSSSDEIKNDNLVEDQTKDIDLDQDVETDEVPKRRSAEGRLKEVLADREELKQRLQDLEAKVNTPMPPVENNVTSSTVSAENKRVVDYIQSLGFVSKGELDTTIQQVRDRALLDSEHLKMEGNFNGSDGRPAYKRSEIESFMRTKGIYDPEVAYKTIHESELLDWELKKLEKQRKERPYVEKSGQTGVSRNDNSITREKIEEAMKTPEGRLWYERNREKILTLMQQGQL